MNNVGEKIKSVRELQKITRDEIAQRSGLSVKQIETIEENNLLPSLTPLIKIARALGVRLGTFLDDQENFGPVICRQGNSQQTIRFTNNTENESKSMGYHSLAATKTDRHMEPFVIQVDPTGASEYNPSSHEGEEFIYVLEGKVEVNYGKDNYALEAGDSIYYDSIVAHHVHAAGTTAARILAVVYTPI